MDKTNDLSLISLWSLTSWASDVWLCQQSGIPNSQQNGKLSSAHNVIHCSHPRLKALLSSSHKLVPKAYGQRSGWAVTIPSAILVIFSIACMSYSIMADLFWLIAWKTQPFMTKSCSGRTASILASGREVVVHILPTARKQRGTSDCVTNCFLLFIWFGSLAHGIVLLILTVELASVKPLWCPEMCLLVISDLVRLITKAAHHRNSKWFVKRPIFHSCYFNI